MQPLVCHPRKEEMKVERQHMLVKHAPLKPYEFIMFFLGRSWLECTNQQCKGHLLWQCCWSKEAATVHHPTQSGWNPQGQLTLLYLFHKNCSATALEESAMPEWNPTELSEWMFPGPVSQGPFLGVVCVPQTQSPTQILHTGSSSICTANPGPYKLKGACWILPASQHPASWKRR